MMAGYLPADRCDDGSLDTPARRGCTSRLEREFTRQGPPPDVDSPSRFQSRTIAESVSPVSTRRAAARMASASRSTTPVRSAV